METEYNSIVVDGNNLYHRCSSANQPHTTTVEGQQVRTGGVYGMLRSLKRIEQSYGSRHSRVFVIFDNSDSKHESRRSIDPEYKRNRSAESDGFYRGINILQEILLNYANHYYVVYKSGYEADDLVLPLLSLVRGWEGCVVEPFLLVSEDEDWARSISETVHWLTKKGSSRGKERIIDPTRFEALYGFAAREHSIELYKAFRGDGSDNIPPGVPRIREKALLEFINHSDSLEDLVQKLMRGYFDGKVTETWIENTKAAIPRLRLNYNLVSFDNTVTPEALWRTGVYPATFREKTLRSLYRALGLAPEFDPRITQKQKKGIDISDFFNFENLKRL